MSVTSRFSCIGVVAVGCLLAGATVVSAECAWMLWQEEQDTSHPLGPLHKEWPHARRSPILIDYVKNWKEGRSPNQEVRPGPNSTSAEFITYLPA